LRHRPGGGVELDVTDRYPGRGFPLVRLCRARPAENRSNPSGDLPCAERLDDVVVGPELETDDAIRLVAVQ
jgi:hypothetical protein